MARPDRLQSIKEVAETVAWIGREFTHSLLSWVSPLSETDLRDALEQLIEAEFLFRRGALPNASFLLKHALVRDAAHQSLLKATLRDFHLRIVLSTMVVHLYYLSLIHI